MSDSLKSVFEKLQEKDLANAFVHALLEFEAKVTWGDVDFRREITGPICDELFAEKTISGVVDGVKFQMVYSGNIARELVMSRFANNHIWEPQTTRLLRYFCKSLDFLLIGGSFCGDQALFVAKDCASDFPIFCFEPNPSQRATLNRNSSDNGFSSVISESHALYSRDGETLIFCEFSDDAHSRSLLTEDVESGEVVDTVRIDTYLRGKGYQRSRGLIMLDIEGGEYDALLGATELLELPPQLAPIVIFETHRLYVDWDDGLKNTPCSKLLRDQGYEIFALRDFQGNLDLSDIRFELIPLDKVYLEGPPHGFNLLAVKDSSLLHKDEFNFVEDVSPKYLRHKSRRLHAPLPSSLKVGSYR